MNQLKIYSWKCSIAHCGYIDVLAYDVRQARKLVRESGYDSLFTKAIEGKPGIKRGPRVINL